MPVEIQKWIRRADLRANPEKFYVFGDNEARVGLGGQAAEMRGEPNAFGVATLKAPGRFWTDADIERQNKVLTADFWPIANLLNSGATVVFPEDGIGTGLAQLEKRAPRTWAHLQKWLDALGITAALRAVS